MVDPAEVVRPRVESDIEPERAPVMFENLGAWLHMIAVRHLSVKSVAARSTWVFSLVMTPLPSGYSATQEEYEEARRQRKEILIFLDSGVPTEERDGHLNPVAERAIPVPRHR